MRLPLIMRVPNYDDKFFFSWKSEKKKKKSNLLPMFCCLVHSPMPQTTESTKHGKNSHIPRFGKISDKLTLFQKYLAIYHFFSTRVPQNRVLNSTRIQWTRVPSESQAWHYWPGICIIKKIIWYSILLKWVLLYSTRAS